jgi:hypothetical protein
MIRGGKIRAYFLHDGGPDGSGYAGVPYSDWVPTFFSRFELSARWLASILKAFLDHSPWNYSRAIDRAIREGDFPTEFETE